MVCPGCFPCWVPDVVRHRDQLRDNGHPYPDGRPNRLCARRGQLRPEYDGDHRRRSGRGNLRGPLLAHLRYDDYELGFQLVRPDETRSHTVALQPLRRRSGAAVRIHPQRFGVCIDVMLAAMPFQITTAFDEISYQGIVFHTSTPSSISLIPERLSSPSSSSSIIRYASITFSFSSSNVLP